LIKPASTNNDTQSTSTRFFFFFWGENWICRATGKSVEKIRDYSDWSDGPNLNE